MNRAYNLSEWRPWEQNASPMLLTLTLNAGMRDLRDYFGMPLWTSVIIYEDNQAKWLFRPKELKLLGQKMLDFLMCLRIPGQSNHRFRSKVRADSGSKCAVIPGESDHRAG